MVDFDGCAKKGGSEQKKESDHMAKRGCGAGVELTTQGRFVLKRWSRHFKDS